MLRAVVILAALAPSVVCAQAIVLEHARMLEARADYEGAAMAFETYAASCLTSPTAVLEEGQPCADTADALARAFELRRVLGHADRADADADAFIAHFLYARPRRAVRIAYARARMHLAAGRLAQAEDALERFEALHPDAPPGQAIIADALRARIAAGGDRPRRAATYWRRVERRWERERAALDADGPVPLSQVREAVAEGRLMRAEANVERFLAVQPPRGQAGRNERAWWRRTMSPWLVRTRRRLLLARMELERVYELGSPRHSVVAAARIGEMYGHHAELYAALTLPDSDWIRVLVTQGEDRPGYEDARYHFETCVGWARHHGVSGWAERCEQELHHLDPYRYPLPAELHGAAGYRPVSHALPAEPR